MATKSLEMNMKKISLIFGVLFLALILGGCNYRQTGGDQPGGQTGGNTDNNVPPILTGSKVDMSNKGLTSLAGNVFDRTGVTEFDVSNNRLTGALPSEIGKWKQLAVLDASDNQMTGIPAEIGQLRFLKTVDYSNNQIDTMPNEIVNLTNLEKLSLAGNLYRETPETLVRLLKLSSLDLSNNRLTKLPNDMSGWKNLRTLNLAGNPLPAAEVERARQALPATQIIF